MASVTENLCFLRQGDASAYEYIWNRFFGEVARFARSRLRPQECSFADEEDVALSVFRSFYEGVGAGRFTKLVNRDDLWRLLLTIAAQKVIDQRRYNGALRRGGRVQVHSGRGQDLVEAISRSEPPDFAAMLEDERERLLAQLEGKLRPIARLRLEGRSNAQIAAEVNLSTRSVSRKCRLIHMKWSEALNSGAEG